MNEARLTEICSSYGQISSVKICKAENIRYNSDGDCVREMNSRGVAFVCFTTEDGVDKAIRGLGQMTVEDQKLFVAK